MKLYSTKNSTFSRRVRIALHEKEVDLEEIDTPKDARSTPEYRALNPYGRIPTLVDGDLVVYESTAILGYLEERVPTPALLPDDPGERARALMHVKLCDLEFSSHAIRIQWPKRVQVASTLDEAASLAATRSIESHYGHLERELTGKSYLVAERFTMADLVYVPFLHFHELLGLSLPPAVASWWAKLSERPSVLATVPDF